MAQNRRIVQTCPGFAEKSGLLARARLAKAVAPLQDRRSGEMAEWLKAHAWKACVRETVPWVRIPLSPPDDIGIIDIFRILRV
jgi:hypothetical protein